MLRSMFSGVSGLKNHQVKMDVIGNNIANVNTIGFKASRVTFQDIYSQSVAPASSPDAAAGVGGTNPMQIGLGVKIGSIDVMHTRAAAEYTGAPLDLSIAGDGFFTVASGNQTFYTRAGNFSTDSDNNLVTSTGMMLMGVNYDPLAAPIDPSVALDPADLSPIRISGNFYDISINKQGEVTGINNLTQEKEVIARIAIASFNNQNALEKMGESVYSRTLNSGLPSYGFPGTMGTSFLNPSSLEMSNVDLAKEFTDMIVTQRGFQANSRVITVSDQILEELVNIKR